MGENRQTSPHGATLRGFALAGLWLALALLQGCAGLSSGSFSSPSATDYQRAALAAVRDPNTWVPALGAGVFLASDWDRELSTWARRETPLFGSTSSAGRVSDGLLVASLGGALGSALLVPQERPYRLGVQVGAVAASVGMSYGIKYGVGRTRPDGSDDLSFPSGHASSAFAAATLTRRSLAQMGLQDATRRALDVGFVSLAAATAWARVEAGVHYPSDVLAGAALGNFVAAFVNDAFLREGALATRVSVSPLRGGAVLQVMRRF